jgi:hypothetical protein
LKSCEKPKKYNMKRERELNHYLTPTTNLKSSSNDRLRYLRKLNLLPGAKWTYINMALSKIKWQSSTWKMNLCMKTHCDKSITQCQVVRPANRTEKLLKEASLQYIQTNLDHTVLLNTPNIYIYTRKRKNLVLVNWYISYNVKEEWNSTPEIGVCSHKRCLVSKPESWRIYA